jgi:hypothetical protein
MLRLRLRSRKESRLEKSRVRDSNYSRRATTQTAQLTVVAWSRPSRICGLYDGFTLHQDPHSTEAPHRPEFLVSSVKIITHNHIQGPCMRSPRCLTSLDVLGIHFYRFQYYSSLTNNFVVKSI